MVFLNGYNKTCVDSDISVVSDKDESTDKGCNGVTNWIIEIMLIQIKMMNCHFQIYLINNQQQWCKSYDCFLVQEFHIRTLHKMQ